MLKNLRSLSLLVALFGSLIAQSFGGTGNLESLMNAFIATIAKDNADLKADIALWQPKQPIPPGHQVGRSVAFDYYTFRPKTWGELSEERRQELMKHQSLKAFIVSVRNERIYPAISAASPEHTQPGWYPVEGEKAKEVEYRVKVDASEMVKNRPSVVPVQPVEKK